MTCSDIQKLILEREGEGLPEAASAHLLECADCRRQHARSVSLARLLALKRHEQPDPHFEVRNLARIQAAIRDLPAPSTGWGARLLDLLSGRPAPALRLAAAFVVLGMIAINWLSVRSLPPLPRASIEALRAAQPASYHAAAAVRTPSNEPPLTPLIVASSNQHPWMLEGGAGPQYGTWPSRLTGFEY